MKKDIYVVGAVILDNGKILCAQRGLTRTLPLKWEFPGGKIEVGESPREALRREIQEEMHCTIEVGQQIISTDHEYEFGIVHLSTFYCKLIEGTPILTEHASIKWLYPDGLGSLDWAPADIPTVEKVVNAK